MAISSKYLDSVLKVLPAIQARQITDLLNELRASGQIRNASEYEKKLIELSRAINSNVPVPSFNQIRGIVWEACGSAGQNVMMKAAQNDIEAAYEQTDEIGNKINDHHFLMMKNMFADLEKGLKEQETTIRKLEWLSSTHNEFNSVLVNSFKSSSLLRTSRAALDAETLYFDNRTYKNILVEDIPNAVVSERGEKLILKTKNDARTLPLSARLLNDENSFATKVVVDLNNSIDNLIDGTANTFWTRNVYLEGPVEKVSSIVELDLGVAQDINYLILEGATQAPFLIEGIVGLAPDGHEFVIDVTSHEVAGKIRIDFDQVHVRAVKITCVVYSYFRGEYYKDTMSSLNNLFKEGTTNLEKKDSITPLVHEVLTAEDLIVACGVPPIQQEKIDAYIYTLSIDNIWFGNALYEDQGIFVSSPLRVIKTGVLGVQGLESITEEETRNSIEYEIIKIDRAPLTRTHRFPIPRLDQEEVKSERLVLIQKEDSLTTSDVGALRFCPFVSSSWTSTDPDPIVVYKDGVALVLGIDWELAISKSLKTNKETLDWVKSFDSAQYSSGGSTVFANYTLNPQKMYVKISSPSSSAVYTVDYSLRFSESAFSDETVWLNEERTIYMSERGRVRLIKESHGSLISDVYLQITLRRNASRQSISPELKEYVVLASNFKG